MALINGIYVFVEDESLDMNLECTEHPVEEGTEITDHIQRKSVEITLKGKIVDYDDTVSWEDYLVPKSICDYSLQEVYYLDEEAAAKERVADHICRTQCAVEPANSILFHHPPEHGLGWVRVRHDLKGAESGTAGVYRGLFRWLCRDTAGGTRGKRRNISHCEAWR